MCQTQLSRRAAGPYSPDIPQGGCRICQSRGCDREEMVTTARVRPRSGLSGHDRGSNYTPQRLFAADLWLPHRRSPFFRRPPNKFSSATGTNLAARSLDVLRGDRLTLSRSARLPRARASPRALFQAGQEPRCGLKLVSPLTQLCAATSSVCPVFPAKD